MYNTISYAQTKERFNRTIGSDRDKSIGGNAMSMINSKQQRSGNKSPPSIMHS